MAFLSLQRLNDESIVAQGVAVAERTLHMTICMRIHPYTDHPSLL